MLMKEAQEFHLPCPILESTITWDIELSNEIYGNSNQMLVIYMEWRGGTRLT